MGLESIDDLQKCFKNKIIPLLQEYFYDDYAKIGMILGSGFLTTKKKVKFADFDSDFFSDDIKMYDLNTNLSEEEFVTAIYTLLNKSTEQVKDRED
jgi:hypothetical protein